MPRNYYCLVAGLKEYQPDSDGRGLDVVALRDDIVCELYPEDRGYIRELYTFYDIINIISLHNGRDKFNDLGNFSAEELRAEIERPERLPGYIAAAIVAYRDDKNYDIDDTIDTSIPFERTLWTRFYENCAVSGNEFIRLWYAFDMELRNISAAFIAREQGREVSREVVGESEVAYSLRRSSAADFGLKAEVDYLDSLMQIIGNRNMLKKERQLDELRWSKADELTEFDYFNTDKVLAYCVKLNIIHRWLSLDPDTGEEMLRTLVAGLSDREALSKAENK